MAVARKIHGVGVDIVQVDRVRRKLENHGDKFAEKLLTSSEYVLYKDVEDKATYVAKCWAVKEAFVKALGTGFADEFMWGDVGYFSPKSTLTKTKRPIVQLSDRARWSDIMRNKKVHLSVSDEIDNVIAYVTIEEEYNVR